MPRINSLELSSQSKQQNHTSFNKYKRHRSKPSATARDVTSLRQSADTLQARHCKQFRLRQLFHISRILAKHNPALLSISA
jgi:hypothetical protein